ncbi:MAG TPA: tetratricopeptide repeat protein [Bryobacteraceae bacterium]|jgi:tetratricopeptide (TPR) repeat protein
MVSALLTNRAQTSILAIINILFLVPLAALCQSTPAASSSLVDTSRMPKPAAAEEKMELSPEARGDVYMARKMYRDAIEAYRQAPTNSPITWNKIGIAYHQMLQLSVAQKNYEHALKIDPKYSEAVNNLGTIFYAKKKYRSAISRYNAALKIKPDSASYYSNLGTAYFARKDYVKAALAYQTAVKLDPDIFENHNTFGTTLQERSVEEFAKFHFYLAKTYAKAGQNDRALLYIRKSLEEGFKDRKQFLEDPEFAVIRTTQEFKDLMTLEPRVL